MEERSELEARSRDFQRNEDLEALLDKLNGSLSIAEEMLLAEYANEAGSHPLIFVMGPLRSGTTLFMQWLASTGLVAYPTNLLSRFYAAPLVGALVQQMLTDERYDFRGEMADFHSSIDFDSVNGKTKGVLAPNEFWYFWRRFLPAGELDAWDDEQLLREVDSTLLVRELTGLTSVFDRPFALKGMILNYHIPYLDSLFDNCVFIQIKRDPVANVASILQARKRQFGHSDRWYSFKIPEYHLLAELEPVEQSVGQLHYINSALASGMARVPLGRRMFVSYERFCQSPVQFYSQLLDLMGADEEFHPYHGPEQFSVAPPVEAGLAREIETAFGRFAQKK